MPFRLLTGSGIMRGHTEVPMPVEPSRPGVVRCLSCDTDFKSPDRLRIRRCQGCKKKDADLSARELGAAAGEWSDAIRQDLRGH